jgi:alpha-glucosidase
MNAKGAVQWWRGAVIYQIYPRSFLDTDGDGVGDLEGIRRRLDHLVWLGVDAIWLSPIFPSPMKDFGYDVADYCDVDPRFGTLAGLDRLLAEAHARGLKLLLDWVPNHTSDQHAWFVESRSSRTSPKRGWYVWRDPAPGGGPPNDWKAAFPPTRDAWTLDEATGQYWLHQFLPEQPDLDWTNPEVVRAMHDVLRFWLDRGVDGFRIDVAHGIGKDPAFPNERPEWRGIPHAALNEHPSTHEHLRALRALADRYPGDRVLVGEIFQLFSPAHERYFGQNDELHLAFDLPASVATPWEAQAWRERIASVAARLDPIGAWPTWVLSNHDTPRHRTRFGSEGRARAAAVLLLALRGTAFLYAGEELGLEDAAIPDERRVDPGSRDGCRAPIPWDETAAHGWATAEPWLPWPPDAGARNAARLRADDTSILHLYRRLLAMRRTASALRTGALALRDAPDAVVAFDREDAAGGWTVLVNFADRPITCPAAGQIAVASDGVGEGTAYAGTLGADQAVLLRR